MDIKKVLGIGLGIVATGVGVYVLKNKEPQKYSSKWLETAPKDLLEKEREFASNQFRLSSDDYQVAVYWERIRDRIIAELGKRAWNGGTDYMFPVHSEHGWHLPSDD